MCPSKNGGKKNMAVQERVLGPPWAPRFPGLWCLLLPQVKAGSVTGESDRLLVRVVSSVLVIGL